MTVFYDETDSCALCGRSGTHADCQETLAVQPFRVAGVSQEDVEDIAMDAWQARGEERDRRAEWKRQQEEASRKFLAHCWYCGEKRPCGRKHY